jgi:hypothetical protein
MPSEHAEPVTEYKLKIVCHGMDNDYGRRFYQEFKRRRDVSEVRFQPGDTVYGLTGSDGYIPPEFLLVMVPVARYTIKKCADLLMDQLKDRIFQ